MIEPWAVVRIALAVVGVSYVVSLLRVRYAGSRSRYAGWILTGAAMGLVAGVLVFLALVARLPMAVVWTAYGVGALGAGLALAGSWMSGWSGEK